MLGDLKILSPGHSMVSDYKRELLLDSGLSRVTYTVDNVVYTRTAFCSYPDKVMVVRIEASEPGSINSFFSIEGRTNPQGTSDEKWGVKFIGENTLSLYGKTRSIEVSEERLKYESRIIVIPEGGSIQTEYRSNLPLIHVVGANSVTLYMSAATSFKRYDDVSADPVEKNNIILTARIHPTYLLMNASICLHRAMIQTSLHYFFSMEGIC